MEKGPVGGGVCVDATLLYCRRVCTPPLVWVGHWVGPGPWWGHGGDVTRRVGQGGDRSRLGRAWPGDSGWARARDARDEAAFSSGSWVLPGKKLLFG